MAEVYVAKHRGHECWLPLRQIAASRQFDSLVCLTVEQLAWLCREHRADADVALLKDRQAAACRLVEITGERDANEDGEWLSLRLEHLVDVEVGRFGRGLMTIQQIIYRRYINNLQLANLKIYTMANKQLQQ